MAAPKKQKFGEGDFDFGDIGDLGGDWGPMPEWGAPDIGADPGFGFGDPGLFPDPGDGSMGPMPGGDSGGGWSSIIGQLGRLLGGGNGSGTTGGAGLGSLANLLPLLAMGGGALFQRNNTQQATDAMLGANRDAQNLIQGQMTSGQDRFRPYTDQGREAVWNMNAGGAKPLAGNYQPLGSGRGMSLGKLAGGR